MLLGLLIAAPAWADFFNGRNLLIGERASLLGGAFTALSDDATAGYYNPAGLVQAPGFTVAAAADVYAFYLFLCTEQVNEQGDRLALNFVRTVILPSTFALSYRVHPRITVALHIFSPDRFRLSAINSIDAPVVARAFGSEQVFDGLSRSARFDQQSTLYGVSAGLLVTDTLSFGVSLHYHLAQTSQALASTYFTRPAPDGSSPGSQATLLADNEVTSGGLIPQVGVLLRLPKGLRVGVNWQCETLMLHSQNSWQLSLSTSEQGAGFESGVTRGDTRYPHRFSLGLGWKSEAVTLSETFVLRGGLFTNTSSASAQFAEERIDLFGGVFGLGVRKDGLETGFGVMGQFGRSPFQRENEAGFLTQWTRAQLMFVMGGSHRFFEK